MSSLSVACLNFRALERFRQLTQIIHNLSRQYRYGSALIPVAEKTPTETEFATSIVQVETQLPSPGCGDSACIAR
jgi:hypothetical protein